MRRSWRLALTAASIQLAATVAQAQEPWSENQYNPQPAEGDLILPMPCGGSMTFRPIEVDAAGDLDDRVIRIGRATDRELAYREDAREEHVAGAFTIDVGSSVRVYFVGKYEVTIAQYAALTQPCEDVQPSGRTRLAATDVSWFDAVEAARAYSGWLLANAAGDLPTEGDLPPYVRLPTEAEWEFAARGGLKVDAGQFAADVFPMPEGGSFDYIQSNEPESAGGRVQQVGLTKPNPLFLHDMLGNASEMTMDLYRLNRAGRLHGQAGGFVVKGGSVLQSASQMRTAFREEAAFFTASGQEAANARMGFRLALTQPIEVSQARLERIVTAWGEIDDPDITGEAANNERALNAGLESVATAAAEDAESLRTGLESLPDLVASTSAGGQEAEALRAEVERLTREASDADARLRGQLAELSQRLQQVTVDRNDQRDRAIRAILRSGAVMGGRVAVEQRTVGFTEEVVARVEQQLVELRALDAQARATGDVDVMARLAAGQAEAETRLAQARETILARRKDRDDAMSTYVDLVAAVAQDYSDALVEPQLEALARELQRPGFEYLEPPARQFVLHVGQFRTTGQDARDAWIEDLTALAGAAPR